MLGLGSAGDANEAVGWGGERGGEAPYTLMSVSRVRADMERVLVTMGEGESAGMFEGICLRVLHYSFPQAFYRPFLHALASEAQAEHGEMTCAIGRP